MSTTGTIVKSSLPIADSILTDDAVLLRCLNAAIAKASPRILAIEYVADIGTLAQGTYEYSLSTLDGTTHPVPTDIGISRVYVDEDSTNRPETLHRKDVRQRFDQSTGLWTLIFTPTTCLGYDTKTFSIEYHYVHPVITALGNTIDLPLNYLIAATLYEIAYYKTTLGPTDAAQWRDALVEARNERDMYLRGEMSHKLTPLLQARKERLP